MRRIDLHCHSTASDGSLAPARLVEAAAEAGLAALALTDHDTTLGLAEALATGSRVGVEVVPGVEMSVATPYGGCDVLGYLFDPDDVALREMLASVRAFRRERAPRILERLAREGVAVTMADVEREVAGEALGRPHIARALVAAGAVADVQEAFDLYLAEGRPAYVPKERLDAAAAIGALHAAGGVAALAHAGFVQPAVLDDLLSHLVRAGLDGLEVAHPAHDATARAHFARRAERLGLVATGGSDFHGDAKPDVALGVGRGDIAVPYEVLDALRARRGAGA